ncbi:MAG: hypothetical protein CTY20_03595 [Hyphomicrobium sp.]|nr:MAG: hypothetical protein CTY20_03595 [Hyphomicrobium sp.]
MQRHLLDRVDDAFDEALAHAEQNDIERQSAVRRTNFSYFEMALARLLEAERVAVPQPTAQARNRYLDDAGTDHGASPDLFPSSHSDVESILGIDAASTRAELFARRRQFARRYHPDVVPSARRNRAEDLMKIANAIIDDRLSALSAND